MLFNQLHQSHGYRDLPLFFSSAHATLAKSHYNINVTQVLTHSMSMSIHIRDDKQHARAADIVGETNTFSYTTEQNETTTQKK